MDVQTLQTQWNETNNLIERWMEERQEILVKYCELTEITDFSESYTSKNSTIHNFCGAMVDYVSLGHFEIFDRLIKEAELFGSQSDAQDHVHLLEEIQTTTEIILDFNDKYNQTDDLDSLVIDLASLGKTFVSRFADEDKLIDLLHSSNVGQLIANDPN
jgi:regulator of sigma D